jgi:hypothetical protein
MREQRSFSEILDGPNNLWEREEEKFTPDNKVGWSLCNTLSTKPLNDREREFVASLMRQILRRRSRFLPSLKQVAWLRAIWWKYQPGEAKPRAKEAVRAARSAIAEMQERRSQRGLRWLEEREAAERERKV